jgi:hypothetical protein
MGAGKQRWWRDPFDADPYYLTRQHSGCRMAASAYQPADCCCISCIRERLSAADRDEKRLVRPSVARSYVERMEWLASRGLAAPIQETQ